VRWSCSVPHAGLALVIACGCPFLVVPYTLAPPPGVANDFVCGGRDGDQRSAAGWLPPHHAGVSAWHGCSVTCVRQRRRRVCCFRPFLPLPLFPSPSSPVPLPLTSAASTCCALCSDCWAWTSRDAQGNLQPDPTRFPNGMPALQQKLSALGFTLGLCVTLRPTAQDVDANAPSQPSPCTHSQGPWARAVVAGSTVASLLPLTLFFCVPWIDLLLAARYTSAGPTTCSSGGRNGSIPGSYQHQAQDAALFASWNIYVREADGEGKKKGRGKLRIVVGLLFVCLFACLYVRVSRTMHLHDECVVLTQASCFTC
jgi:hypothetical protein